MTVPTGVHGLLPTGTVGLILGRSFTSLQGIHLIPGVIDSDYTGEIKITLQVPTKTVQIPAGWRVAQVPLPFCVRGQSIQTRGDGCFVSSNLVFWVEEVKKNRPFKERTTGQVIKGLLDTRADVSCIVGKDSPASSLHIRWCETCLQCCSKHSHFGLGGMRK